MPVSEIVVIAALFLLGAALYSSVGHGGASSYLAVMGLFGLAPAVMKPTALTLNILVALIATVKFYRAGLFSWNLFWPFAAASIPAAFVGGAITLPGRVYLVTVGAVLIVAALWMVRSAQRPIVVSTRPLPLIGALSCGLAIGFVSGLTGVGGGIFLSPLLLYLGWADTRAAAGVAAPFILANSIAGLLGHLSTVTAIPPALPVWAGVALIGGWIGATYGSRHAPPPTLRRLLAVVLVVAGLKLILAPG